MTQQSEEKARDQEKEREKKKKQEAKELTKAIIEFLKDYRAGTLED